jgi:DNA-binding CsgD family transcriptional regulator/uncharacterized protein YhfF
MGTTAAESFWRRYSRHEGIEHGRRQETCFRTDPAVGEHLIALATAGAMRAVFGPMHHFGEGGYEPVPQVGDHAVLLDRRGRPCLIWRTTGIVVGPLCGVTDAFVWRTGIGDGSRSGWLRAVGADCERQARLRGFEMHDAIETVFETFDVVWPRAAARNARLLGPRLDRGLELIRQLEAAREAARVAEAAMAAVETAVMTLGPDLRLRTANPAADALLRRGDGLRLRGGQVQARRPRDERALRSAAGAAPPSGRSDAAPAGGGAAPRAAFLPIGRGEDRTPYRAGVFPLRHEAAPRGGARVLLVVEDPDRPGASPGTEAEFLARAFGLTGAEAHLAVRIGSGASLPDAADALGIARSTARTHLTRLFDRTDVRRQAELVRLLRDCRSLRLSLVEDGGR